MKLYTEEFCNKTIRALMLSRTPGIKPVDLALMVNLISRLPIHESSFVSNEEMGECLGCDRRVIADSYERLKAKGWIHASKRLTRSKTPGDHRVVDRAPATVLVNFDKLPTAAIKNPVTQDAKELTTEYLDGLFKQRTKASTYAYARGKVFRARQERAMQKIIDYWGGDVGYAADFMNFAAGRFAGSSYRSAGAQKSLVLLYRERASVRPHFDEYLARPEVPEAEVQPEQPVQQPQPPVLSPAEIEAKAKLEAWKAEEAAKAATAQAAAEAAKAARIAARAARPQLIYSKEGISNAGNN
jgi:hypothetical protein